MGSLTCRFTEGPCLSPLPLAYQWHANGNPLPVRDILFPDPRRRLSLGLDAPPWYPTGPLDRPFDFCGHVRRLCVDMTNRCEALRHIDCSRLLIAVTQARSGRAHGLQARVTPLRFRDGCLSRFRRGVEFQVQRYFVDGKEMLYLVTFCLPRFLDQDFDDKFITLFHELFHISPEFNGDLRRLPGRCAIHSHSKEGYDALMADLAREYLSQGADASLFSFLRLKFAQLHHRHQGVQGIVVPRPKVIPVMGY